MQTHFSKLLLFGEHTVNLGSQALAMPLTQFSGQWKENGNAAMQYDLHQFTNYLSNLKEKKTAILDIDCQRLKIELNKGLYFDSNAPLGYGTGSSGILCAAIYERFGLEKLDSTFFNLRRLKQGLALMECFFHGKSSGIDPLISYLNEPILITSEGIVTVNLPTYLSQGNAVFLLDTGISRKAESLIHWFMKEAENVDFQQNIKENLVAYNNKAIAAFLEGHWTNLMHATHQISDFQLQFLTSLIPNDFHNVWKMGLENDVFKLKICGAGGGGFILGITRNFAEAEILLKNYTIIKVFS